MEEGADSPFLNLLSLILQVMYFSSLFPYVVLFCFLIRGLMLKGSVDGIYHMFTPKVRSKGTALSFSLSVLAQRLNRRR